MNLYITSGNLTANPELNYIENNGQKVGVVRFTVAHNRSFKKADGTFGKDVTFVPCEAWDTGAERIANQFSKGDAILIEGQLRNFSYVRKTDNQKISGLRVRVSRFERLTRGQRTEATSESTAPEDTNIETTPVEDDVF